MATKKTIAICQSGGEFVTSIDGSLAYQGGEAYATDIDLQTKLTDLKSEVAEMFGKTDPMIIKYLLPSNKKTLITIAKDKDLQRMINYLGDAATVDLFVIYVEEAAQNTSIVPQTQSRSSKKTVSETPTGPLVDVPVDTVHPTIRLDVSVAARKRVPYVLTGTDDEKLRKAAQQWENIITGVDQRFRSLSEFREALHKYSIAHGFAYKCKKNDAHRVTVKCKSEGCPWKIYVSRLATTQLICIKKMIPEHTCEGAARIKAGYRSTRGWVGNIIKEKLKVSPNYKPRDIADDIKREYGVELNYSQAWRAKEIAKELLKGSYKQSYTQLPSFCENIKETNPGSFATLTTKEDSSFHRLFVSFQASISGFQRGCRPLLFLASSFLNTKYQGELLTAMAADGDDGIFPVAFGVVDSENEENWHWFLQELKSAISTSQQITFVADFQNGLKESLAEIFENCYHGYCLRHLAEKLNKDLKGQFSHEQRHLIINDFYAAAYATKPDAFARSVDNIKNMSLEAYNWVLQSEPKHWSNAFFGGARYNHLTSDFGQEFYGWVSETHDLPIIHMVDVLRCNIMETIYSRRVESNQWTTKLVPSKEEMLRKETSAAQSLQVLLSQSGTYEVCGESIEVVNIDAWECSCKGWQITGLPCCHAIAVLECIVRSPRDYCSRYFAVENYRLTYAESIRPVSNDEVLFLGESARSVTVTPPSTKRPPGRPKLKQVESEDAMKRPLQCSKCKGQGHNRKTCKSL